MDHPSVDQLTRHQQRILAALAALADHHDWPWWSRDDIGRIVQAGGYHGTIQRRSMTALKRLGLVQTEDSSWPESVRELVRCTCACCNWGLTAEGRALADGLKIRMSPETGNRIKNSFAGIPADARRDEDEFRRFDDDDDEEPWRIER